MGEDKGTEWICRGVHAVVHGLENLENQIVKVLRAGADDQIKCVVRATNEQVDVPKANLRPVAGAEAPAAAAAVAPDTATPARATGGSDWAAAELERRRLAEGFRSGFREGATVLLQGLSAADLNGKTGKLLTWDSQALRWQVDVEEGFGTKALRPANLVPQEGAEPASKR